MAGGVAAQWWSESSGLVSQAVSAILVATVLLVLVVVDLLRRHGRILRTLHELDGGEDPNTRDPAVTPER